MEARLVVIGGAALALLALPLAAADYLRPQCPPAAAATCSFTSELDIGKFSYNVSGRPVTMKFADRGDFELDCDKFGIALHSAALPRFPSTVSANRVALVKCAPPQNLSYEEALAALNITSFAQLVLDFWPAKYNVTAAHLAGLARLRRLAVYGGGVAAGALRPLVALHELALHEARVPSAELARLPDSLVVLTLRHTGAARVHLNHLPRLLNMEVLEEYPVDVNALAAPALQWLLMSMPNMSVSEDTLPSSLAAIHYYRWNNTRAAPLTRCARLKSLTVTGLNDSSTMSLPDEWVASCPVFMSLVVKAVPLRHNLSPRLLARATALNYFTCTECSLSEVPLGMFDDNRQLLDVNLSHNEIKALPSTLFEHTNYLQKLDLSYNHLTSAVADSLHTLRSLRILHLDNNSHLGDLCLSRTVAWAYGLLGASPLCLLSKLTSLYLANTNIKHVCYDWRNWMPYLKGLDLDPIAFENLTFQDLQYKRWRPGSVVYLGNGAAFNLLYTREDYETVYNSSADAAPTQALIKINGTLRCNCQTYWAALTLRTGKHAPVKGLRCGDTELSAVDVDTLTCDASMDCAPLRLPAPCSCRSRPDHQYGAVVIVTCERANLTTLPQLPPASHKWRLYLAYNNISTIDAADVSADIVELDLRNNTIQKIEGQTLAKLENISLLLTGNQLECGCEAFDMLTALSGASQPRDAENVTCTDGKPMMKAPRVPCAQLTGPVVAGLAMLLAVILVAVFAQPKIRQRLKTILVAKGWLPPRAEPEEDCHKIFDVFVSFAHEDEQLVVEELVNKLESGSKPYRLCLHYREWAPGEWIPAQIAASVRSSRRTLAVVSQHYVRSAWARAEFREAHAASLSASIPRLVVVLLEDLDSLPLDAELNAYVRQNTYVRWGDPWFWKKLRQALPPPRAPQPEITTAATAPPDQPTDHEATAPAPLATPRTP